MRISSLKPPFVRKLRISLASWCEMQPTQVENSGFILNPATYEMKIVAHIGNLHSIAFGDLHNGEIWNWREHCSSYVKRLFGLRCFAGRTSPGGSHFVTFYWPLTTLQLRYCTYRITEGVIRNEHSWIIEITDI